MIPVPTNTVSTSSIIAVIGAVVSFIMGVADPTDGIRISEFNIAPTEKLTVDDKVANAPTNGLVIVKPSMSAFILSPALKVSHRGFINEIDLDWLLTTMPLPAAPLRFLVVH